MKLVALYRARPPIPPVNLILQEQSQLSSFQRLPVTPAEIGIPRGAASPGSSTYGVPRACQEVSSSPPCCARTLSNKSSGLHAACLRAQLGGRHTAASCRGFVFLATVPVLDNGSLGPSSGR